MYICASYAPKPKVDTTKVDSTVFQEEIVLDDEGNPIIREVPAKKAEDESATGTATTEEKKEKKKLSQPSSLSTSMIFKFSL